MISVGYARFPRRVLLFWGLAFAGCICSDLFTVFYGASCVDNMTGMQCVRCIMISYMSVFSVLRRSRAGNLHAALTIEGIWYWLRSVCDFDKCESGNGWETLGVSREAVVLTDLITQKAVGSVPRGEREGHWDPVKIYAAYNHLTQPWF